MLQAPVGWLQGGREPQVLDNPAQRSALGRLTTQGYTHAQGCRLPVAKRSEEPRFAQPEAMMVGQHVLLPRGNAADEQGHFVAAEPTITIRVHVIHHVPHQAL